ncbi:hypothetical protein TREES_T100004380 [Tupaia chinensis]|uniref:Uncharacterized protein n=1 Tax=Tupaia chinensis TaxID=246437 RepID=L9KH04_TUPCH|nr:hypothetical protein TREES_T100004380 [Tupaia chinensis]
MERASDTQPLGYRPANHYFKEEKKVMGSRDQHEMVRDEESQMHVAGMLRKAEMPPSSQITLPSGIPSPGFLGQR